MTNTAHEAPERIWVDPDIKFPECEKQYGSDVEYVRADRIEELESLIKDFFTVLDKKEETDDGRVFRPNHINSCRAEDGQKLENLLRLMKATVEGRW